MAKLSFGNCILFLLFASAGTLAIKVAGESCNVDLGSCDADCFSRCKSAHPDGQGSCAGPNICRCSFSCKTCKVSLGMWGPRCTNSECMAECVAKYPQEGTDGYCLSIGEPSITSCFCEYKCW